MYTLRTVFESGIERDNFIGKNYELIPKKAESEFQYYFNDLFPNPELNDIDNVYGLIITDEITIPLYRSLSYYIVGKHGNTFRSLKYKPEYSGKV